jgi:hypothetical protein
MDNVYFPEELGDDIDPLLMVIHVPLAVFPITEYVPLVIG